MEETAKNGVAAPQIDTPGTATQNINVRAYGFFPAGTLSREKNAIRVDLQGRTVYLGAKGVNLVVRHWIPCNVLEIILTPDGEDVVRVGRAWRSRSGRALILRLAGEDHDLIVAWRGFMEVINGRRATAPVSWHVAPSPAPVSCVAGGA